MATPVFVDLPADVWTLVATNVISGQLHLVKTSPHVIRSAYVQPTGAAAPTAVAEGVPAFSEGTSEVMSFSLGADVYLRPEGEISRVRVDV